MRVLLVTWTEQLLEKLSVLNPALEYCAIVTDEVEPAKKISERVGLPASLIQPLYDLKECVKNFYCDYILCLENGDGSDLTNEVKLCEAPKNKILNVSDILSINNFLLETSLRYWKEKTAEFEMFATGISYTLDALDAACFKRRLFNFANASQDLYYDFKIAKAAVLCGGHNKIKYVLIGLAPYSFYYDLSKTSLHFRMLKYFAAFGDLHNFFMPAEVYGDFFRKEFLASKLSVNFFDVNDPLKIKKNLVFMTRQMHLNTRREAELWNEKIFSETRNENIKILDDYLTLCEENNIRPIMFLPPMSAGYIKHFNREKADDFYYLIKLACRKHRSAIFIDGRKLQGFPDSDFRDSAHLNAQGAAKFSTLLNNVIEQLEG